MLHPGARVNHFEEKAGFDAVPDLYHLLRRILRLADAIAKSDVIDLTAKMHPDGTLDWTPPAGQWVVLRIGYSLLGITNHPATTGSHRPRGGQAECPIREELYGPYLDSYKETVGAG